jgi:hypothetical protein
LPAGDEFLTEVEKLIENFVLHSLNVSKDKCYLPPRDGGLGLFKPSIFFKALNCTWIKRCLKLSHDNWRRILHNASEPTDLIYIQLNDAAPLGPILRRLVESYIDLRNMYGTINNNFNVTPILNNKFFWYGYDGNKHFIDNQFFSLFYPNIGEEWKRKLCWTDITNLATGNLLSINQLNTSLGDSDRAVEGYRHLNAAFKKAKKNLSNGVLSSMPFYDFIQGKIKNSKTFRRIMMSSEEALTKKQPKDPITNLGQDQHDEELARVNLKQLNSLWTKHFVQSDFRTFLFKLYHNILGLNIRVAHINPMRDPSCFFCLKSGNLPAVRESYSHREL